MENAQKFPKAFIEDICSNLTTEIWWRNQNLKDELEIFKKELQEFAINKLSKLKLIKEKQP